jgi:hypothetical protein
MSEDHPPVKANKYRQTGTQDLGRPLVKMGAGTG